MQPYMPVLASWIVVTVPSKILVLKYATPQDERPQVDLILPITY